MQLPNEECNSVTQPQQQHQSHHLQQQQQQQPSQQLQQQTNSTMPIRHECFACKKPITDRYLLKAIDKYWHEDCLKCSCCDCRLGEVGSTLFTKADLLLCRRDYLRLFGTTGYCSVCTKLIPAFEMVMRARENVYHLECFACQQCNHRFCVGDRYYLLNNQILCEYDYEERLVYSTNHAQQPYGCDASAAAAGAAITKQEHHHHQLQAANQGLITDDGSSGYGSPSPTSV